MAVLTTGLETQFFFNKDFSWEKSLDAYTFRSGSRGSWVIRSTLGLFGMGLADDQTTFIPSDRAVSVGKLADASFISNTFLSVAGGYAYDLNFTGRWFATMVGTAGVTGSLVTIGHTGGRRENAPAIGPSIAVRAGISYVGEVFHGGLSSASSLDAAYAQSILVSPKRNSTVLFFGTRF
jgi:hypothetical protein